jgi:hypothetical protein
LITNRFVVSLVTWKREIRTSIGGDMSSRI